MDLFNFKLIMAIENKYLPPIKISDQGKVAIEAALAAGRAIRKATGGKIEIKEGMSNVVNEADYASGKAIRRTLNSRLEVYNLLSEEGDENFESPLEIDKLWIVDELDGSKNFADSLSDVAVSIAYAERGVVKVGVVYNPITGQLFYAEEGKGSFYMGKAYGSNRRVKQKLQVSSNTGLSKATVETSISYDIEQTRYHDSILHSFHDTGLAVRSRMIGSSVMQLSRVASGGSDLHFHSDLKPWDLAAGSLLVKEAGGVIKRMDGSEFNFMDADSVAGNPKLVTQFIEALESRKDLIDKHLALRAEK